MVEDLTAIAAEHSWQSTLQATEKLLEFDYDALHMALLSGLPRQLGNFDREQKNFFDMSGKRFKIFPGSGLAKRKNPPEWLMNFALVETSQVFARCCAEVKPEWLMSAAPQLCTPVYDQARYNAQNGFVSARERITCGRLLIHPGRSRHYGPVNPVEARRIFIKDALIAGAIDEHQARGVPWLEKYLRNARKVRKFELKVRRPEMLFDEAALTEFFEKHLPENFYSLQEIKNHWKRFHKSFDVPQSLLWQRDLLPDDPENAFPDTLTFCDVDFQLEYRFAPGEERDGITLIADTETVKLLPHWSLEALVPGFVAEKVECYLRSLLRKDRQKISPISDYAKKFAERWNSGRIFNERPLGEALAEELARESITLNSNAFEEVPLPEYLKMKLLILNEDGCETEYLTEVPALERSGSQVSAALPSAGKFHALPGKTFPQVPHLPQVIKLTDKSNDEAYPALFADSTGLVGAAVYLKEAEARYRHDQGLCALLTLQLNGLFSMIRKDFKLDGNQEKIFFKASPEHMQFNWKDDLLASAILEALGTPEERWQIRSKAAFDTARENARSRFSRTADELFVTLKSLFEAVSKIKALLKKLPANCATAEDITYQLQFYFQPGFLRRSVWHSDFKRYLRGIELRLQRAIANPRQDANKLEPLEPFIERFDLALENCPDLALAPILAEFGALLEEMRLAVFAPEVRTRCKVSQAILQKAWETLRY